MNTPATITIPAPSIGTGPTHLTPTEAAESYLRDTVDRVKKLGHGSGVTALVDRLLADVIAALAELNAGTPTPERVTLTDAEREHLRRWIRAGAKVSEFEDWLTDRRAAWEAEVRAQVKADLLAKRPPTHANDAYAEVCEDCGYWIAAARIAGGDA